MPRELEHRKRKKTLVLGRAFGMHLGGRKRRGLSRKEQGEQFYGLIILMAWEFAGSSATDSKEHLSGPGRETGKAWRRQRLFHGREWGSCGPGEWGAVWRRQGLEPQQGGQGWDWWKLGLLEPPSHSRVCFIANYFLVRLGEMESFLLGTLKSP